jgi:glycosyltransferase involved in cell wall biosynthesis
VRVAIYHNLPPGGALRVLHEFVRQSRAEHEYDLYTLDLGPFDTFAYARDRAERHDITPWVANAYHYAVAPAWLPRPAWTLTSPAWVERAQRRIAADIDARGYAAALVYSCHLTHSPGVLRHLRTPSLYYMNEPRRRSFEAGYQPLDRGAPVPRRAAAWGLERLLRRQDAASAVAAGRIVTNSYYSAESIRRAYGRDAAVCYLGIDTATFDIVPTVERSHSVMSVGALDRSKGHDLVVRALAMLPPASRPALDLVYERCDPAFRAEVEAIAESEGVDLRLHFGIADAELARMYSGAAATVVAARLEPFGLVPLESIACGAPVVATREAGYRETVVDGVNGYLVDRSVPALAEGITRALAGGLGRRPEELRWTVVPRWGWDAAVKRQLEQLAVTAGERRG